jgi:hypothetical protein
MAVTTGWGRPPATLNWGLSPNSPSGAILTRTRYVPGDRSGQDVVLIGHEYVPKVRGTPEAMLHTTTPPLRSRVLTVKLAGFAKPECVHWMSCVVPMRHELVDVGLVTVIVAAMPCEGIKRKRRKGIAFLISTLFLQTCNPSFPLAVRTGGMIRR